MTARREFIKHSVLGASLMASTKKYLWTDTQKGISRQTVERPACRVPVIQDVDLVIVGGGCAAVATAIEAKKAGSKVFLMTEEPYLGEDLCGTLRYEQAWSKKAPSFLDPLLKKTTKPTPMQYKEFFDSQMLQHEIPFLLTSQPSRVLLDDSNRVAGLVLVNRSGEQIVRCKAIVDGTSDGGVLKLSDVATKQRSGDSIVEFTVMGDNTRPSEDKASEIEIEFNSKKYFLSTYQYKFKRMVDKETLAKCDSMVRGKTWSAGMVDSADKCYYLPSDSVDVKEQSGIESTKLVERADIYCLNGFGIQDESKLSHYLNPYVLTELGSKLGGVLGAQLKGQAKSNWKAIANADQNGEIALSENSVTRGYQDYLSVPEESLPIIKEVDVLVVGGGTAGAGAGVGAAETGAKTLVLEPLHGLGGTGTLGMISVYYYGYEGGFNKRVDVGVRDIGGKHPKGKSINYRKKWINHWKMEWYRKEIENLGGEIWFGSTACGALVKKNELKGVVVGTSFEKGIILAKKVIDATGSSDIAIAAGADYTYTNKEHAAIQGSGVPGLSLKKEYYNTDWTFISEFDAFDTTRALTLAKKQNNKNVNFDNGKMVQTRERRRIVGELTIDAMDILNHRTYDDAISYHRSNFDTHGYTVDPFFQIKPPHKKSLEAAVPLRALLPVGFNSIVVTGLGFSAHRDAMPVLRMQRCLQNQGYALGLLSGRCAKSNQDYREFDLKPLQAELKKIGVLPPRLSLSDSKPISEASMDKVISNLNSDLNGLEILLDRREVSFPRMKKTLKESTNVEQKEAIAFVLGMYGHSEGVGELISIVKRHKEWDKGWNYRGMGQFGTSSSSLDNYIIAMGRCSKNIVLPELERLSKSLTEKSGFSHYRALAIACETIGDTKAADLLMNNMQKIGKDYTTITMKEAREKMIAGSTDNKTRNDSLKELVTARALYRCGDKNGVGKKTLEKYSKDLRGHYALHAQSILGESQS